MYVDHLHPVHQTFTTACLHHNHQYCTPDYLSLIFELYYYFSIYYNSYLLTSSLQFSVSHYELCPERLLVNSQHSAGTHCSRNVKSLADLIPHQKHGFQVISKKCLKNPLIINTLINWILTFLFVYRCLSFILLFLIVLIVDLNVLFFKFRIDVCQSIVCSSFPTFLLYCLFFTVIIVDCNIKLSFSCCDTRFPCCGTNKRNFWFWYRE